MVHTTIGNLGHFAVIFSFVTSLVAAFSFFKATQGTELQKASWAQYARFAFYAHALSAVTVVVCLFVIIQNHYFEYHYAYRHSDLHLPTHYMISCFWDGQEGSFLLWIFWHVVLGLVLIHTNKTWQAPVMTIFLLVQAFLVSMILGVVIFNVKIGSSPFILLRDLEIHNATFQLNPDFVPKDGLGLNPLLQNYWMVIHPPTLFLGFATTLIPFAYCLAGLWTKRYREWIRPALPWTLFSAMILGVGILMGAYWAYETLNFGGYWNWDPVENAVYVPWLVLIASYHTMITYKNSNTALKTSMVLVIATFILILYATFLTRSGILGDASVHSFTDLGLSGQLLIYLSTFFIMSIGMVVWRWKNIPTSEKEISSYSREFWIFIGVTTLCLMAFQVIITTSFPVYNTILEGLGIESNLAMPADQVIFYSQVQLWFALVLALLSGTGQFFWWKHMDPQKLRAELTTPILISLVLSALVLILGEVKDLSYILLLTASIYSVVANLKILLSLFKSNFNLAGGSVAHIGIGMILIGILFSSGYSEVMSVNNTGLKIANDEEFNSSNLLLFIDQAQSMGDYDLTYKGRYIEAKGVPGFINLNDIAATDDVYKAISTKDITRNGKTFSRKSDTLEINPENIYFEVAYQSDNGKAFTLWPRIQVNPSMGQVHSPDIKRALGSDLYSYVSWAPYLDPEEEVEWKHSDSITVKIGEQFFVNDFVARLTNIERTQDILGVRLNEGDLAVKATIELQGASRDYIAEPFFLIKNNMAGRIPDVINDLGVKITLSNIHPQDDSFDLDIFTTQKDFIVLKAISKPMINVLWIGTLLLVAGFVIAIRRRYSDFRKMRDKGVE